MLMKLDVVIWKMLLFVCSVYKNVEMVQRVFEEIFKIDFNDFFCYVFFVNVYVLVKRWCDVSEVRKLMRDRDVKKEFGVSWFEYKGEVYWFKMGDCFQF